MSTLMRAILAEWAGGWGKGNKWKTARMLRSRVPVQSGLMSLCLVNMFVRSGMREVAVAGHIRAAGLDDPIPVVRQRQSFLPPFQKKKKEQKTSLVFPGLVLNNKLSAQSSPRVNVLTILTYCCRAYSMCQYRQHGSHYVSYMESLSWKIQIQKGHTANGEKNTSALSERTSVWFGSSMYLD